MTTITKIGNSRGVRIPKAIIKQANLENTEIEFKIGNEGLLLKPISNQARKGWEQKIKKMPTTHSNQKDKGQLDDFLNHEDDIENWQW